MRKVPVKAAISLGLAIVGLSFLPTDASAFVLKRMTLKGDARNDLEMEANIVIKQGADAGLQANQARWTIELSKAVGDILNEDLSTNDNAVGFKSFGFNTTDALDGKVSFAAENDGWQVKGNGTQNEELEGSGGMNFDYVYAANRGSLKQRVISFIATFDEDGDANTIEKLYSSAFTSALFSSSNDGGLTGQAAGHVIGFDKHHIGSGVVAGEVPTPALLPGLVGMGIAAVRKRKRSEEEQSEA